MAKRRVLLVDDEEAVAKGFARALEAAGYETEHAGNGLEALRALERSRFDAMVTDVFMPERDGLEAIREVRRLYPEMGIVAVSGGFGTTDVAVWLKVARALGARCVLKKPVSNADLLQAVSDTLSTASASDANPRAPPESPSPERQS
jgi:CheY-like chemotaxis protein